MSHFTGDKDIGIATFPIKSCILEVAIEHTHTHTLTNYQLGWGQWDLYVNIRQSHEIKPLPMRYNHLVSN